MKCSGELLARIKHEPQVIYTFAATARLSIVCRFIRRLTGQGMFTHAGVFVPDSDPLKIIHAPTGSRPVVGDLAKFLKRTRHITVQRICLGPIAYDMALSRIKFLGENFKDDNYVYRGAITDKLRGDRFYCCEENYFILDGLIDHPYRGPIKVSGLFEFKPWHVHRVAKIVFTNHPRIKKELKKYEN